jgi:hypothetical protein
MTSLFEDKNNDQTPQNYFEQLVGEGKKFKDQEALAKSKWEADRHIDQVHKEQAELRADYLKLREEHMAQAKLQELVDQLKQAQQHSSSNNPPANNDVKPGIKPEEIESLLDKKLSEREIARRQEENFNIVRNKLQEKHGDNSSSFLQEQMNKLGLSKEDLDEMARKHPQVFIQTLGLNDTAPPRDPFQAPTRPSVRNDNFKPNIKRRDWAYYQELKNTDPKTYWKPETQNQMHLDAAVLGNAFETSDWDYLGSNKF